MMFATQPRQGPITLPHPPSWPDRPPPFGTPPPRESAPEAGTAERLLAIMGHELRSPLSAITMAAGALTQRGELSEPDRLTVVVIQRCAARMARLIERVLGLRWLTREGGCALQREPADLLEIASELLAEAQAAHADRPLLLRASGDAAGRWDRLKLSEVLSNLLANAIQHGDGSAPVTVEIEGDGPLVVLRVHNQGPPIPPEVLPHVFDPFRRPRGSPRAGHLGLGLFLVREIVDAHGGTVQVSSSAAEGTTFTVHLPRGG